MSAAEAASRLQLYGPNALRERPSTSVWSLLFDEFRSPLIVLLLIAAAVLFGVAVLGDEHGEIIDASLITLIVLFNAGLGFTQNYRADRGIEALQKLGAQRCLAIRDGKPVVIPSRSRKPVKTVFASASGLS